MYREKLIEKFRFFFKRSSMSFKQPIFIWGMPRGGTTLLHDLLYLSDDLESFTIREKRYKKEFGVIYIMVKMFQRVYFINRHLSRGFLDCG